MSHSGPSLETQPYNESSLRLLSESTEASLLRKKVENLRQDRIYLEEENLMLRNNNAELRERAEQSHRTEEGLLQQIESLKSRLEELELALNLQTLRTQSWDSVEQCRQPAPDNGEAERSIKDEAERRASLQRMESLPPIPPRQEPVRSTGRRAVRRKRPSDFEDEGDGGYSRKRVKTSEDEAYEAQLREAMPDVRRSLRLRPQSRAPQDARTVEIGAETGDSMDTDMYQLSDDQDEDEEDLEDDQEVEGQDEDADEEGAGQASGDGPSRTNDNGRRRPRYSKPRSSALRFAKGTLATGPVGVKFVKTPRTVLEIWKAWFDGSLGNPPLRDLEERYNASWRNAPNEYRYAQNWVSRRKKVVDVILNRAQLTGQPVQEVRDRLGYLCDYRMHRVLHPHLKQDANGQLPDPFPRLETMKAEGEEKERGKMEDAERRRGQRNRP